ncbi:putative trna (cytosine-5-)-methyltransferase ncl1 protein [Zalerion maritima]|uniref:Nucleolar protein 2 n=1 Tax=Zalerion maritima TaxID=339359 RepID=A0AAD5RR64_9PEZI|nr:putative trna (cytosine-5-)-methyltransferase ncl1 protein [Zalerion maritima]
MGVGRRMKKQGPPEPLSEEHFARLKRKAGLPVDDPPAAPPSKKKRTGKEVPSKRNSVATKKGSTKESKNGEVVKPAATVAANGKKSSKPKKKQPEPEPESKGSDDDDEFDEDDLEVEGLSDLDDEVPGEFKDDFLESDDDEPYDSDDQNEKAHLFSEDEDESDAEEKLTAANIQGLSRKLDEKLAQQAEEAEAEQQDLQLNITGDRPKILDDLEEDGDDADLLSKTKALLAPDLQLLRNRINDTVRVLDDFGKLAEEGRARAEYVNQLLKDICAYYGYSPFLCEKLFNLFSPREAFAFFEANEKARPMVIRTNTLRTHRRDLAQALINRGVTLEPVGKWSKVGLQIFDSTVPIGATPEYLSGHYILQAASSFLPVMALQAQEHERVLDMASAPGGKTTHLAAVMKNTGCIFANELKKSRAKALIGNVHRLGCRNVVVCNYDAREFPHVMGGFDRVLLDAPCSGTGVIAKDPSVKTNKTERDFIALPHMQKQLLLCAIDSVNHTSKTGGYVVYSTCSVTIDENESVVAYALSKRPNVRLVETGLTFGKEGFTSYMGKNFGKSLSLTRRFYPHTYNMDGFFVAKFQKIAPTPPNATKVTFGKQKKGAKESSEHQQQQGGSGKSNDAIDIGNDDEFIDKTPIVDEDESKKDDNFGGFDEEEDREYIERAKRNAMRRRGLDPRALRKGKTDDKEKSKGKTEKEA